MNLNIKNGFTLAEVLIVVAIIGIVAILTMPTLFQEVSERINSNREANIAQKITKAMEVMTVNGDYNNFTSTEEFVNSLKKYLKIVKVCDSSHLTDCWPAKVVTTSDNNKYNVSSAKTGRDLHVGNDTDNVGLVLADGAVLILTYNPNSKAPSAESSFIASKKTLPVGNGKTKEFAYTSNVTAAIDYVVDLNGGAGPNSETSDDGNYYDIRSFRAASFSTAGCVGIKINGVCVVDLGTSYNSISCVEGKNPEFCGSFTNSYGGGPYALDSWAGGRKACADIGMRMPTFQEVKAMIELNSDSLPQNLASYWANEAASYAYARTAINAPAWTYRSEHHPVLCVN